MQDTLGEVLAAARESKMPVVMDADALLLVLKTPELVMGWREVVLTPNVVEFGRLWESIKSEDYKPEEIQEDPAMHVKALSNALGGVTIVQKGSKDLISNGEETLVVDLKGGLKRSGGQGDTLTGSIATFLGWRKAYLDKLWDHGGDIEEDELLRLAAFGGAAITKVSLQKLNRNLVTFIMNRQLTVHLQEASRLAFAKRGRSLQASDLIDEVHVAFTNFFGEIDK